MRLPDEWTNEPIISQATYPSLRKILREWWQRNGRQYPWRTARDPYAIFLAEVILQKTQVAKAEVAYKELYDAYPTAQALAQAPLTHLQTLFTWLGLVKRAQFLHDAATIIVERYSGRIPQNLADLKRLPAIGDYSANAILCFAYGQATPIVDSTVARVLKRLLGFQTQKEAWEDRITWEVARAFLDTEHPVEHNYGLLDLAALICLPEQPRCDICPLQALCAFATTVGNHIREAP